MVQTTQKETTKYINITKSWSKTATPNSHEIKELKYYKHKGKKYYIDNKKVVLDYKLPEL